MAYILGRLISWNIKFEKVDSKCVRVYGNFDGFSVIRESEQENYIEVDGRLIDYEDFEDWLYVIKQWNDDLLTESEEKYYDHLKASRFLVSCENYESKVFIINNERKYKEVTNELSEDDKTELIDDLIYAITDLVKRNRSDQALWQLLWSAEQTKKTASKSLRSIIFQVDISKNNA